MLLAGDAEIMATSAVMFPLILEHDVMLFTAEHDVVLFTTEHDVILLTAEQDVMLLTAEHDVVLLTAEYDAVLITAEHDVVSLTMGHCVMLPLPVEDDFACERLDIIHLLFGRDRKLKLFHSKPKSDIYIYCAITSHKHTVIPTYRIY